MDALGILRTGNLLPLIVAALGLLPLAWQPAPERPQASVWCVDKTTPGYNPGAPCANATNFTTISAALSAAQSGDQIRLADGSYSDNVTVGKAVELYGGFGGGAGGFGGTPGGPNLSLLGGAITLNASLTAHNLTLSGDVSGADDLLIAGEANWTSGIWSGGGTTRVGAGATLNLISSSNKVLSQRKLINAAAVEWSDSGDLVLANGATVTNGAGASFDVLTTANISAGSGTGGSFANAGTFSKGNGGASSDPTEIAVPFNNSGTVDVHFGILAPQSGSSSGHINVDAGAIFEIYSTSFNASYSISGAGASISGAGKVRIDGGTLNVGVPLTLPNLELSAFGTLVSAANITLRHSDWSGGAISGGGRVTVPSGGVMNLSGSLKTLTQISLSNSGTVNWSGPGNIQLAGGADILNQAGASFDVAGDAAISAPAASGSSFENKGTFVKSGGSAQTLLYVRFNNAAGATLRVNSGAVQLRGGGSSSGAINIAAAAQLEIPSGGVAYALAASSVIAGAGPLQVDGNLTVGANSTIPQLVLRAPGTISLSGNLGTNNFGWVGGTVQASGATDFAVANLLQIGDSGPKYLSGARLRNLHSATWSDDGNLQLFGGAVLENSAGADFTILGNGDVLGSPGLPSRFENAGTLTKSGDGSNPTTVEVAFENSGTLNVYAMSFQANAGGANSGLINCGAAGAFEVANGASNFALNTGTRLAGSGPLRVLAGTLSINTALNIPRLVVAGGIVDAPLDFTVANFDWQQGTLTGPDSSIKTTIPATGTLTLPGSNNRFLAQHSIDNFGHTIFADNGLLTLANGGVFNNRAGATLDFRGDGSVRYITNGVSTLENAGTLLKSGGNGSSEFFVPVNNSGTVRVGSGEFRFSGGYTQSAGATNLEGGDLRSNVALGLAGGALAGSGEVFGSLVNSAGQISPGASPGAIGVHGDYEQRGAASLKIEIGAGQYDHLDITNMASLGGSLNMTTLAGYDPPLGAEFTIITCQPCSGRFASVNGRELPGGRWYYVEYNPNDVTLLVVDTASVPTPTATPGGSTPTPTTTPTGGRRATITPRATRTPTATITPGGAPTATPTPCALSFSDVHQGDYFYPGVTYLACRGVISGYQNGTFQPFNLTTRAQTVKIIVLARGFALVNPPNPTFADVPTSDPFYRFVETAVSREIISGYGDGLFRPYNNITRGQLCKVLTVAIDWDLIDPVDPHFNDTPPENPFYLFIETAARHGVIGGYADGSFRWSSNATRGQIAKVIHLAVSQPALAKR